MITDLPDTTDMTWISDTDTWYMILILTPDLTMIHVSWLLLYGDYTTDIVVTDSVCETKCHVEKHKGHL